MNLRQKIARSIKTLRAQLLIPVTLIIVVIVAVLTSVVTRVYTQTLLEQEELNIQSSFSITAGSISTMLDSARTTSGRLIQDVNIRRYATNLFSNEIERVLCRQKVLETLDSALLQYDNLYGILFMRSDGSLFGTFPYRNIFSDDGNSCILNESISSSVKSLSWGESCWIGPIPGEEFYARVEGPIPDQIMLGVSCVRRSEYGTMYVLCLMDTSVLDEYINMLFDGRSDIYLVTDEGMSICTSSQDQTALPDDVWSCLGTGSVQGSATISREDGRAYVSYCHIEDLNWHLVRVLPMAEYDRSAQELRHFVWKAAILIFCVALLWYLYWLRGFLKTFIDLKAAIVRSKQGKLNTIIAKPFSITEFEEIRKEFNSMNIALEQLLETTKTMERTQVELELRYLQTQLSPHMIFNSITAIRWQAFMMGVEPVSDMLAELSEMLRPVFRDWTFEWTIREELEHLNHYGRLLDLRYSNSFSMSVEIPDEMLGSLIPRFTIQPLVENACEHGGMTGSLRIEIRGWLKNGRANLSVYNNGESIHPENLAEIQRKVESGVHTGRIGLINMYNRLKICRGQDSTFCISCPPEGGTLVELSWQACDAYAGAAPLQDTRP